jgi:D-alanine-D-alanine ligase
MSVPLADKAMKLPNWAKDQLHILFLAKHAFSSGIPDTLDGTHAVYHHEMLTTLKSIGLNVSAANGYDALFDRPDVDFVVPLLNRGGFQNSEMLAPLLLERHGKAYLGASPIIRGLSDDKHLMKLVAHQHHVPTMDWVSCRIGTAAPLSPPFKAERFIVKPNASSASWGVALLDDWLEVRGHVEGLHAQGHDALIEAWVPEIDVAVPVIGGHGPLLLPAMAYLPESDRELRSYEEKRGLVDVPDDPLIIVEDPLLVKRLEKMTRTLMTELWPFDYGRFEFRVNRETGEARFMEVNLSCNLWSKKTISRSAASVGIDHQDLLESIIAHSLARQGLLGSRRSFQTPTQISVPALPLVPTAKVTALILAGRRDGRLDPLAELHDVSHKCLVPVAGKPMISHVIEALAANPAVGTIRVSVHDAEALNDVPIAIDLMRQGRLLAVQSQDNIADSISEGTDGASFPILVTTADNVLLTSEGVSEIIAQSQGADAGVVLTRKSSVLAAHPAGQRRFYSFSDDAFSNCNTYWIGNARAMRTIEVFRSGGQFVKHPDRIFRSLGFVALICFVFGIGSLGRAFERISQRFELLIRPIIHEDGALAIDVDNERSHAIAEELLSTKAATMKAAA